MKRRYVNYKVLNPCGDIWHNVRTNSAEDAIRSFVRYSGYDSLETLARECNVDPDYSVHGNIIQFYGR